METNKTEAKSLPLVLKSGVDIMRDAVFQEIISCVENDGIILAMVQGNKDEVVLQEVVDTLQNVQVLGLTHDACQVLISHRVNEEENESLPFLMDAGSSNPTGSASQVCRLAKPSPNCSLGQSVKNALFEEIVHTLTKDECSLIMASGLMSESKVHGALEILGNGRIIYLAPDACEVLMENRSKPEKNTIVGKDKNVPKSRKEERTCHTCNKQFSKRSGLLTHQKAFHEKKLPHKCDLCDKAFVYPKELRIHKMSHTGERPYHCKICNKGFIARKDVQRHQPVHTGERAFACEMCTATFAHKANLDRHIKGKHEGRRPYVCSLCVDKKYCDRGGLRKHLASIHRIFDVPRKKVIHRMLPKDPGVGQTQTCNMAQTQGMPIVNENANFGGVGVTSEAKATQLPLTSHTDLGTMDTIQLTTDTPTIESASKILQQFSQNVAELADSHSTLPGLTNRNKTFNLQEQSLIMPSIFQIKYS